MYDLILGSHEKYWFASRQTWFDYSPQEDDKPFKCYNRYELTIRKINNLMNSIEVDKSVINLACFFLSFHNYDKFGQYD